MDKEKKVKKSKKYRVKSGASVNIYIEEEIDLPGVEKLNLSKLTQRIIGCVVGENITTENRWRHVKKEVFEDNLELHEGSSEFLPIKDVIIAYPEEDILVGLIRENQEESQPFYICTTQPAKQAILEIIAKEQEEINKRLKNAVHRTVGVWNSLGSEEEVDESNVFSIRPLYEIEIETKYPMIVSKVSFKMRMVEDVRDGYVELLPGRFPYNNVIRKRVDAAVQVAPYTKINEAQTIPTYPRNTWTQYEYEYKECLLNASGRMNCSNFMSTQIGSLADILRVNNHINFHENDYGTLLEKPQQMTKVEHQQREVFSFKDLSTSKGYLVTSISWHPTLSGILAASYGRKTTNFIIPSRQMFDTDYPEPYENVPVLIWCYNDFLKPKLYLQTTNNVTNVCFCPYNGNLVLGGCKNGQIIIWDITNKLEDVETEEVLTASELKHRFIMLSMMNWMKNITDAANVKVAAVSDLESSHRDNIIFMKFLSCNYELDREGHFQECAEEQQFCQFITVSLDGSMFIWDIKFKSDEHERMKLIHSMKKSQRLKKRPSVLASKISQFHYFHEMKPLYKLIIHNSYANLRLPITTMATSKMKLIYEPTTETDLFNIKSRSEFKFVGLKDDLSPATDYFVTSTTGRFAKFTWEGYEFATGQMINSEVAAVKYYSDIHDGPITRCVINNGFENIVLTSGGSIFAIWNVDYEKPLFWRRNKAFRYTNATWLSNHISSVLLVREDGVMEMWDFSQISERYMFRTVVCGDALYVISNPNSRLHVRKRTYAMSDSNGSVRIFHTPSILQRGDQEDSSKVKKLFDRELDKKISLAKWNEKLKAKYYRLQEIQNENKLESVQWIETLKYKEQDSISEKSKYKAPAFSIFTKQVFVHKREKYMYEIMLQRKNLDLKELEMEKDPLMKIANEEKMRIERKVNLLARKDAIFDNVKESLLETKGKMMKLKYVSDYYIDESVLLDEFEVIEQDCIDMVNSKPFDLAFDWNKLLLEGRNRRKQMEKLIFADLFRNYKTKLKSRHSSITDNTINNIKYSYAST